MNYLDKYQKINVETISLLLNINLRYGLTVSYDIFEVVIMRLINNKEVKNAVDLFSYIKLALKNNNKVNGFDPQFNTYKEYEKNLEFEANTKFSYSLLAISNKVDRSTLKLVSLFD